MDKWTKTRQTLYRQKKHMRHRKGAEGTKDKRQIVSKEKQWEMDSGQHERKRQKNLKKKKKKEKERQT